MFSELIFYFRLGTTAKVSDARLERGQTKDPSSVRFTLDNGDLWNSFHLWRLLRLSCQHRVSAARIEISRMC